MFKVKLLLVLIISSILDIIYWYGDVKNIEFITDLAVWWFLVALIGFTIPYFILNKSDIKYKTIWYIITTIGVLINLGFLFLWYILKDFGF